MPRTIRPLFPRSRARLAGLGQRLRLARLRRRLPQAEMAARVGVSRETISRLEQGDPGASLAVLTRVLGVLGLEDDLDRVAQQDEIGLRLRDIALPVRPKRVRRRAT